MVDYTESLHDQAFPGQSAPKELQKQREDAIAMNARLEGEVETVLAVITDENVASALRQDKESNLEWLRSNYNVSCISKQNLGESSWRDVLTSISLTLRDVLL